MRLLWLSLAELICCRHEQLLGRLHCTKLQLLDMQKQPVPSSKLGLTSKLGQKSRG